MYIKIFLDESVFIGNGHKRPRIKPVAETSSKASIANSDTGLDFSSGNIRTYEYKLK